MALTPEQRKARAKKAGEAKKGYKAPHTLAAQETKAKLVELIHADMVELYAAWKDSALGHYLEVKTPQGVVKVYKKAPNAMAIKDMFERAFGKPTQPIEGELKPLNFSDRAQKLLHDFHNIESELGDSVDLGDIS